MFKQLPLDMAIEKEPGSGSANFDLFAELDGHSAELEKLRWTGTFSQYVEMVTQNPRLARTAHRTLFSMIISHGVENMPDGTKMYPFFSGQGPNALYGLEKPLEKLVGILEAASHGLEPRKRILLLMGPPGGGKSTVVSALKRGLEKYSKTDEGAIYAIVDCPMNEEPLHLIPHELRPQFGQSYDIPIEGDLCPSCNDRYGKKDRKATDPKPIDIRQVPVKRIFFSEKDRAGIGTFAPSDPKSQDIAELVGSVDFANLAQYGTASDPRAYRFDGELNVANRGLMEFVEMLKADEKFLYVLLSLAQEQVIKAQRFANISADEVVISHTNENEYIKFATKPEFAALRDRTLVVPIPYNLRVSEEEKIYRKLIEQGDLTKGTEGQMPARHLSPDTLKVAAMFAVLTRLEPSKKVGMDRMKKLKVYDRQDVDGVSLQDAKELQEEFPKEGMSGISPRYVIDSLSTALITGEKNCLTPTDGLRALRDGLDSHPHTRDMDPAKKEEIRNLITVVRQEYDELAKKAVQSAFVHEYSSSAQGMLDNYMTNAEASDSKTKVKDPITGEDMLPDETLMRSIEEQIGVSEAGKKEFRDEILKRAGSLARRNEKFSYESHPRLKQAIEKKMFADLKDVVKITTSARNPDPEQLRRINDVADRLMKEKGYCATCANETIKYVGTLLNR